jgi:ribosomal protein S18 acetylase RimI-like enzyme
MSIVYREIQIQDYEAVKDQLVFLVEFIASINPLRLAHPQEVYREDYFAKVMRSLDSNKGTIFVALDQKRIVGCIVGILKEQSAEELTEYAKVSIGCITDLYIDQEYRKQGIGQQLLGHIEDYFKAQGCQYSELYVLTANTSAHKLYQKSGYKDNLLEMLKPL